MEISNRTSVHILFTKDGLQSQHNLTINAFCVRFFQILALFPFDDLQISGRAVISGRHEVLS